MFWSGDRRYRKLSPLCLSQSYDIHDEDDDYHCDKKTDKVASFIIPSDQTETELTDT